MHNDGGIAGVVDGDVNRRPARCPGLIVIRDGRIAVGDLARAFRMFGILGLFGVLGPLRILGFLGLLGTLGASRAVGIFARDFAGVTGGSGFRTGGATIAEGASHHRRLRKLAGFRHSARRHPRAGRHAHRAVAERKSALALRKRFRNAPNHNSSTAASAANAVAFGQNRDGDLVEQPFAHGAMGIFPERGRAPPRSGPAPGNPARLSVRRG